MNSRSHLQIVPRAHIVYRENKRIKSEQLRGCLYCLIDSVTKSDSDSDAAVRVELHVRHYLIIV